jgi:hypothetical protein
VASLQADDAVAFAVAIGDDAELDLRTFLQRLARDVEFAFDVMRMRDWLLVRM